MREEQKSREKRRRRRIRNQIFAYLTLIVVLFLLVAAGYFAVKGIMKYVKNYNDKVNKVIEDAESSSAVETMAEVDDTNQNTADQNAIGEDTEGYVSAGIGEDPLDDLIESLLKDMTIEEMVAGMFMVSPESITDVQTVVQAKEGTKKAITENPVGGIVYLPQNFKSQDQFTQMIANTRGFSKFPIFMALKVECGASTDFGMEATAKASELTDAESVKNAYGSIAEKLALYGINMNLAPVSEIVSEGGDASLQGRTFGSDAATAAPLVSAAVQAMQEKEVSAVLQKFPGTAAGSKTLEELKNSEFVIYDLAIKSGVDCIMVSHIKVSGVTGDETPASLSSVMLNDVLRNMLGFKGVIITDYLNDTAITENYSSADVSVAAILAGADILLEPENYQEAYEGVLQAIADGRITKERIHDSMYRIYRVKYKNAL